MILKSVLVFWLSYTVSGKHVKIKDDYSPLSWPTVYNVEATKLYVSSGWTEQLKFWQSTHYSRLDANSGAVIKIYKPRIRIGYGLQYEIHPETTEEETNEKVCYKTIGTRSDPIKSIPFLPDTDDFAEADGNDNVKGVDCVKFPGLYSEEEVMLLCAYYNNSNEHWVPVRYEKRSRDTRHGYVKDYIIFDYFNFHPEVDTQVFNVNKDYDCKVKDNDDVDDDVAIKANAVNLESMAHEEKKQFEETFFTYTRQFKKKYAHDAEYEMRKEFFYKNWRLVNNTNRRNLGYKLALNKWSDRTKKEMKGHKGLRRDKPKPLGNILFPYSKMKINKLSETLPSSYDLRLEGVVGPVLLQDECGSCWSFGTTAAVEGALARSNGGMLIALSNQALLDCSWGFGNSGCDGGSNTDAYQWVMKYGLPTQEEYGEYVDQDGFCNIENMTTTYKIRGWTNVTPLSEQAIKIAIVNHGPLSVPVHASDAFLQYDGGIFYDPECNSTSLDHEVTLVGYGEKDGDSFWILKNSWGRYWGIDGYMHISTRDNNCGVMTEPSYVVV